MGASVHEWANPCCAESADRDAVREYACAIEDIDRNEDRSMDKYTIQDSNGSTTDSDIDAEFYDEFNYQSYLNNLTNADVHIFSVVDALRDTDSGLDNDTGEKHAAKHLTKHRRTKLGRRAHKHANA